MRLRVFTSALVACAIGIAPSVAHAYPIPTKVTAKYLYPLSDNTGAVASNWATLAYDARHKELYVIDGSDGSVAIYNDVGMEIYRFGDDAELAGIIGIDVMDDGDLLVLTLERGRPVVHRCNFRGEPRELIELKSVPAQFASEFAPDAVFARSGKIYLADKGAMKLLVADATGNVLETHDFFRELGLDKLKELRGGTPGMRSLNVATDGTVLFTVAPMFRVFVIYPDGRSASFGQKGGAPGKFNIVGGVARDEQGHIFVSDILKCAVLVFDANFDFAGQFGERGYGRDDLIAPYGLAVGDGKLYVSQSARRGVSVFELSGTDYTPRPAPAQ